MRSLLTALMLTLLTPVGLAADVSGEWALNIIDKDGTHRQATCTFIQEGARLTGRCAGDGSERQLVGGAIKGSAVTWDEETAVSYAATVDDKWRFMKGTFTGRVDGIFTAIRTK
jgi:hypothetical protein